MSFQRSCRVTLVGMTGSSGLVYSLMAHVTVYTPAFPPPTPRQIGAQSRALNLGRRLVHLASSPPHFSFGYIKALREERGCPQSPRKSLRAGTAAQVDCFSRCLPPRGRDHGLPTGPSSYNHEDPHHGLRCLLGACLLSQILIMVL